MSGLADCTIAVWVYWNGGADWQRIFDFGANVDQYMLLTPASSSGVVRFAITLNSGTAEEQIDGTAALPAGQWVHVAVTLAGAVGTLYVNGSAVGSNTAMQFAPYLLGNTTQNWIGRSQYSTDPYFDGLIEEFRIYQGALSAAQIGTLYTSPVTHAVQARRRERKR